MEDELWSNLVRFNREVIAPEMMAMLIRFHREIALPDFERVLDKCFARVDGQIDSLRNELRTRFDGVNQRLDRLIDGTESLTARMNRLADRV